MCDVCNALGIDYKFKNGPTHDQLYFDTLYRIYRDKLVKVKMCFLHDLELFRLGEKKFLENNLDFAREVAKGTYNSEPRFR